MQTLFSKIRLPEFQQDSEVVTSVPPIWWVALSGGLDSCVLLHLLMQLDFPVDLRAVHVNHQISPHANDWQNFCAELCGNYQVPFVTEKVNVQNLGRGIEDAAREARYQVFEKYIAEGHALFSAHHADDQAETFLLRLMRGAGPRGLSAMSYSRSLGVGSLYRPLLNISREEIFFYAQEHNLRWVEDESNQNDQFNRNYLRNQVIPVLEKRWPEFRLKVQQSADLCAQSNSLLKELAFIDLQAADEKDERLGKSLSLSFLKSLSPARRQNLLRFWLEKNQWDLPEINHLDQIESQLINGREDAEAQVNFGGLSLRVFRKRFFALPIVDLPRASHAEKIIPLDPKLAQLPLEGKLYLSLVHKNKPQDFLLKSNLPNLSVRFRQGGERAQPHGRAHSQTLKNLFQDYELEPWLRHAWPLVYSDEQLVAVPGLWICQGFVAEDEPGIELKVSFH